MPEFCSEVRSAENEEFCWNLPNFAKIQNPAVTADKLQPTPDHMPNAALLASSSARPAAALRDLAPCPRRDFEEVVHLSGVRLELRLQIWHVARAKLTFATEQLNLAKLDLSLVKYAEKT